MEHSILCCESGLGLRPRAESAGRILLLKRGFVVRWYGFMYNPAAPVHVASVFYRGVVFLMNDQEHKIASAYLILSDEVLVDQCDVDRFRSSGPGGQKRNKTSSAVRLRHKPTGLIVSAVEDRSQHVNMRRAIRRLRESIALNIRAEVAVDKYRKSECLSSCINRDGQLVVGKRDPRYCFVVAEVLDVLNACDVRVRDTAQVLGISTGQVTHFFHKHTKVFRQVNHMRQSAGVKPLR